MAEEEEEEEEEEDKSSRKWNQIFESVIVLLIFASCLFSFFLFNLRPSLGLGRMLRVEIPRHTHTHTHTRDGNGERTDVHEDFCQRSGLPGCGLRAHPQLYGRASAVAQPHVV